MLFRIARKLLFCFLGAIGFLIVVYGCGKMAKQMSAGEILYRSKCSSCHNIIAPTSFDKQTWRSYIDKYAKKMTEQEKRTLLQYLAGH